MSTNTYIVLFGVCSFYLFAPLLTLMKSCSNDTKKYLDNKQRFVYLQTTNFSLKTPYDSPHSHILILYSFTLLFTAQEHRHPEVCTQIWGRTICPKTFFQPNIITGNIWRNYALWQIAVGCFAFSMFVVTSYLGVVHPFIFLLLSPEFSPYLNTPSLGSDIPHRPITSVLWLFQISNLLTSPPGFPQPLY